MIAVVIISIHPTTPTPGHPQTFSASSWHPDPPTAQELLTSQSGDGWPPSCQLGSSRQPHLWHVFWGWREWLF